MSDRPWLTVMGVGEDGAAGLSVASRRALADAEVIIGPPRHLALLDACDERTEDGVATRVAWPTPFADGIPLLMSQRPRRTVALASGCPFWFGAGAVIARHVPADEWTCHPSPSTFSLAASRLGWSLEHVACVGLHALPLDRLRPHASAGARVIALLRDPAAVGALFDWLRERSFGDSVVTILEALGGPRERVRVARADAPAPNDMYGPLAVGIAFEGPGDALAKAAGLDDVYFANDGQLTKRPIRALTLSALAPRAGERLWDLGSGSGSVAVEWLLCHPTLRANAVERDPERAARAVRNARALGVDHLEMMVADAIDAAPRLPEPDAVFIGGGASDALLEVVVSRLGEGGRLVVNAVTLQTQGLVERWRHRVGGELLCIQLSQPVPLGRHEAWRQAYPILQWTMSR